jgi:hypothetical protein
MTTDTVRTSAFARLAITRERPHSTDSTGARTDSPVVCVLQQATDRPATPRARARARTFDACQETRRPVYIAGIG